MAVHAELSVQDSFVDASTALMAVPAFLLKKKEKRAISVILPSFKRAISLPEVVLPKKEVLRRQYRSIRTSFPGF